MIVTTKISTRTNKEKSSVSLTPFRDVIPAVERAQWAPAQTRDSSADAAGKT